MIVALLLVLAPVSVHLLYLAWLSRAPRDRSRPTDGAARARSIDVFVPTANEERFIADKLENLRQLTYPAERLTLWVLDGDSDDRTLDEAARIHDDRIRLVRTGVRGKSAQMKAGLRRATADLILVTDADARLEPETLTRMVAALDASPDTAVVGTPISPGAAHPVERLHWRLLNWMWRHEARYGSASLAAGPCYLARRALIERLPADVTADDVFVSFEAAATGSRVGWAETTVTELRTPRSVIAILEFRRRRMTAYLREVLRFLTRAPRMRPPARGIFLWRAALLLTLALPLGAAALVAAVCTRAMRFPFGASAQPVRLRPQADRHEEELVR